MESEKWKNMNRKKFQGMESEKIGLFQLLPGNWQLEETTAGDRILCEF